MKKLFLIGNPNVGKSVVFSRLTGVHVVSSNYPGTTVGVTYGYLKTGDERDQVIDLPGTYSLEASTKAEEVAVSLLNQTPPGEMVVINVIDATNLERNLFLTLQLIERGYPVIVCLNMCDDTKHRGIDLDVAKLEHLLGVPVIATCAVTGVGIRLLKERVSQVHRGAVHALSHEERWKKIGQIVEEVQHLTHRHHTFRELLEDASVRPLSGLLMSASVIYLSFKAVRFLGELLISRVFDPFFFTIYQPVVDRLSSALEGSAFWHHLLIGELIQGKIDFQQSMGLLTTAPYIEFAMVLPYIFSFYVVLSLLEDIGYLPRLAILLDNVLHPLGLHGYAIIPVLLGFGCNVPGILATRVLESKRERFIAATLISIGVPCVPLQAMIFGMLGAFGGLYVLRLYLVLFSVLIIVGLILNRTLKGYSPEFLLEIPPYRIPPFFILIRKLFFRIKGFLIEALPVVLLGVLIVNMLSFFHLFDLLSRFFAPLVHGLFGLPPESAVALAIGFLRKDVAVGMLMPLGLSPKQLFIATALLAMTFPCIATFVILLKELGIKALLKALVVMGAVAVSVGTVLNFFLHA